MATKTITTCDVCGAECGDGAIHIKSVEFDSNDVEHVLGVDDVCGLECFLTAITRGLHPPKPLDGELDKDFTTLTACR